MRSMLGCPALFAAAVSLVGCFQPAAPARPGEWRRIALRVSPSDGDACPLWIARRLDVAVRPVRTRRQGENAAVGRVSDLELASVTEVKPEGPETGVSLAAGHFLEKGVPHCDEDDVLVLALLRPKELRVLEVHEGCDGLYTEGLAAWERSGDGRIRLFIPVYGYCGAGSGSVNLHVWEIDRQGKADKLLCLVGPDCVLSEEITGFSPMEAQVTAAPGGTMKARVRLGHGVHPPDTDGDVRSTGRGVTVRRPGQEPIFEVVFPP